jgi:predicted ribosomally synthesized peptide with SipW-like signal peptide
VILVSLLAIGCAATVASVGSLAVFSDSEQVVASISAGRIFPGVRTTSGFVVHDASGGGAEDDRTSPFAVVGDGRTVTSTDWATSFAANRYLQFDVNAPLPAAVDASGITFRLTLSSASVAGTACAYVNVRRISDDASLATYGSGGAPAACVTGTTPASFAISLPVVITTDAANDLRVGHRRGRRHGIDAVLHVHAVPGALHRRCELDARVRAVGARWAVGRRSPGTAPGRSASWR